MNLKKNTNVIPERLLPLTTTSVLRKKTLKNLDKSVPICAVPILVIPEGGLN